MYNVETKKFFGLVRWGPKTIAMNGVAWVAGSPCKWPKINRFHWCCFTPINGMKRAPPAYSRWRDPSCHNIPITYHHSAYSLKTWNMFINILEKHSHGGHSLHRYFKDGWFVPSFVFLLSRPSFLQGHRAPVELRIQLTSSRGGVSTYMSSRYAKMLSPSCRVDLAPTHCVGRCYKALAWRGHLILLLPPAAQGGGSPLRSVQVYWLGLPYHWAVRDQGGQVWRGG